MDKILVNLKLVLWAQKLAPVRSNPSYYTLMDIIDERFSNQSTIVCSQIPVSAWYDIIGEGTIADAILDRLVNSSHRIDLKGESLRKKILENQ